MALKVVELDEGLEEKFLRYLWKAPLGFFFFITDLQMERESTRFLLAMDGGRVEGAMLFFKGRIVHARGSARAVKALIKRIDIDVVEGMVQLEHAKLIVRALEPGYMAEMRMLHLRKGNERLSKVRISRRLKEGDAREVAALMRAADPRLWGRQKAASVRESMKHGIWVGVRKEGKLVAIGMARTHDFGGMIHTIATAEGHRNLGYATANVSSLLTEMFKRTDDALIHVFRHNGPAYRVYTKVGFRPYKRFLYFRCRK